MAEHIAQPPARSVIAGLALALLALTGCGGDDGAETTSASNTPVTTSPTDGSADDATTTESPTTESATTTTSPRSTTKAGEAPDGEDAADDGTTCALVDIDDAASALGVPSLSIRKNEPLVLSATGPSGRNSADWCELEGEAVDKIGYLVTPSLTVHFTVESSAEDAQEWIAEEGLSGTQVEIAGTSVAYSYIGDYDLGKVGVVALLDDGVTEVSLALVPSTTAKAEELLPKILANLPG